MRTASVDALLVALVLCSVSDPARSAGELRRVLRPGGTLHVLEHVHAGAGSGRRRWQDRLDPLWYRLAGGCHLTRDTRFTLERAGFATETLREVVVPFAPPPVALQLYGTTQARPTPAQTGGQPTRA